MAACSGSSIIEDRQDGVQDPSDKAAILPSYLAELIEDVVPSRIWLYKSVIVIVTGQPYYLFDRITPYVSGRYLMSSDSRMLIVPRIKSAIGARGFR